MTLSKASAAASGPPKSTPGVADSAGGAPLRGPPRVQSNNTRPFLLRYGYAALGIAFALWVRLLLDPELGNQFPFATLFLAVLLTARYGGFGPALVAVVVGALAADYFLIPPRGSFSVEGRDQLLGLILYLAVGLGTALLGGVMQAAERKAEASAEAARHQAVLIQESEERVNLALESAQMGSWDLDLIHDTAVRSLRHDQIFGYPLPRPEWGSEIFLAHVLPEDREPVKSRFQEAFAGGNLDMECRILWPDRSVHWIAAQGRVYRNEKGDPVRMLGVVRDVSERKEQDRQIEEASRLKSEFLANMSHELRTPLNAIIGFSELIHDGKAGTITTDQKEYLGDILTSSRHLLQLINDVLDLSKIEAGKMEIRPEPVELRRLGSEVCDILRSLAAAKRITIDLEVSPDLGMIVTDSSKLKQVLYNYLSNALKFTPDEGVVSLRALPEGSDRFRIEVRDSGIGIRPEDSGRLFAEFRQLDASAAKKYPGTGLGLALTKRIVEAQGGQVGVKSRPGEGSVFFAVLPRIGRGTA
jgi:PAS domain S-box-containing protein